MEDMSAFWDIAVKQLEAFPVGTNPTFLHGQIELCVPFREDIASPVPTARYGVDFDVFYEA